MPTIRPRHQITETDAIAKALDEAAFAWPAYRHNRAKLLVKLVEAGYSSLTSSRQAAAAARREAIENAAGCLTGVYGEDYLDDLRSEWPA
jgi:hypothetical protein